MKTKHIIIGGIAVVGLGLLYSFKKAQDKSIEQLSNLKIKFKSASGISIKLMEWLLTFKISIEIANPSNEDIGGVASLFALKRVEFSQNGVYYGAAEINTQLFMKAGEVRTVENIPVTLSISGIFDLVKSMIGSGAKITDIFDLVYVLQYKGTEYRLDDQINLISKQNQYQLPIGIEPRIEVMPRTLSASLNGVICRNRIKCGGLTKNGKLKKGYKFQRKTGNVVRAK
jgi:hypothetical protein